MAQYTPKTWTTGETITAAELNAIEAATAAAAPVADVGTAGTPAGDALRAAYVAAVTPQKYGAKGDGTTDDTAAFASWWNAIKTGGAGYIPAGTYLTTGLTFTGGTGFTITGSRQAVIWIAKSTTAAPTQGTRNVVTFTDCTDFTVAGLTVDGRRDIIAKDQYLTANAASGQNQITVQDGTDYAVGEKVWLMGGPTANSGNEASNNESIMPITAINGNVLTLLSNITHTYTATGAAGGAFLTRYQTGDAASYTVAGRTLGNEDAQNGIHLIACARFQLRACIARNVWESPIRLGVGISTSNPADGCTDGIVTGNECSHGYDQGIAVWLSKRITVAENNCRDAGWAGISLTHSDNCTVVGNVCTNNTYTPASDRNEGVGIAVEGGVACTVQGNICSGNNSQGIRLGISPLFGGYFFSQGVSGTPAAGGTSLTLSGTNSFFAPGAGFTIMDAVDGMKRETITVATVTGTAVTLTKPLVNSYAAGSAIYARYGQDVIVSGNTCANNAMSAGIAADNQTGLRVFANECSSNGTAALDSQGVAGMNGIRIHDRCEGAVVEGNTCNYNVQDGIVVDNHCRAVSIVGNTASYNGVNGTNQKHGIKAYGLTDGRIADNECNYNTHTGIYTQDGSGKTTRVQISGNVCLNNYAAGIWLDSGGSQVTVSGNQVGYNKGNNNAAGIQVLGYANSIFTTNQVYNTQGQEGIRFDNNGTLYCTKNMVTGNLLYDDQTTATQTNPFKEFGNTASTLFANNRYYGNQGNTPQLSGTTTSSGNIAG